MHELVVADIDADVRERAAHRIEEHQIARLQVAHANLLAHPAHFLGAARQRHTERVLEHVAHEAAAIEPRIRRVAAPTVAHADHVQRADDHVARFAGHAGQERFGAALAGAERPSGELERRTKEFDPLRVEYEAF